MPAETKKFDMNDITRCFAEPDGNNIIDVIHPITERSLYCNEDLEQVRARYPGAVEMSIDDFCKQKAARQDSPLEWREVGEEKYYEMLEVLPPAAMAANCFLVGEPWDHHAASGLPRFQAYIQRDGKCFEASRAMTRTEFKALAESLRNQPA